jgi:hypothetical protein
MCARSQTWARPMRQARTFFLSHSKASNRMISPPTTPKTKPGRLLPPNQAPTAQHSPPYQALAATKAAAVNDTHLRCRRQLRRSISTPFSCEICRVPRWLGLYRFRHQQTGHRFFGCFWNLLRICCESLRRLITRHRCRANHRRGGTMRGGLRRPIVTAIFFLGFVGLCSLWQREAASQTGPKPQLIAAGSGPASRLVGNASCSARACHGSMEPRDQPVQRNEFITWLTRDPHATAYQVLDSDRSRRMLMSFRSLKELGGLAKRACPGSESGFRPQVRRGRVRELPRIRPRLAGAAHGGGLGETAGQAWHAANEKSPQPGKDLCPVSCWGRRPGSQPRPDRCRPPALEFRVCRLPRQHAQALG